MPEDAYISLQGLLSKLEGLQNSPDSDEYANTNHLNIMKSIKTILDRGEEVTSTDADRVLKLCLHYKTDVPCVTHMISIISSLININKTKPFSPPFDFIQSSIIILDFLKILCEEPQAVYQRTLAIQILMLHPTDALTELIRHHCYEVLQIFLICVNQNIQGMPGLEFRMEPAMLLQLLDILPDAEKEMFIKEGIPVWFAHVIPDMIQYLVMIDNAVKQEQYLEQVELLVQDLVFQEYFQYPEWQMMIENICNPKMFPRCIKLLLEKGKQSWHRVWILIIKLLKSHITWNYASYGTPINSMLPVVENAFKKEAVERVHAFKCWDELIENFSHETTVNTIGKRMKLLMIPLRLNNAKTEETAAAKLQTWWHLIRTFKPKLDKFIKDILILFLHFMFGKDQSSSKPIFWIGQFDSGRLRKQCLEAFVEIVGHGDCTSVCVRSMSTLNGRILDITMLIDHWNHWYYALKVAIKVAASTYSPGAKANIRCVWKSLVVLIADLPDNNVRRDLFNELVKLLSDLIQDCSLYSNLEDILIDDLMLPLFNDTRMQNLLITKSQEHRPMHNIVTLMTCNAFDKYFKRLPSGDLMDKLKPLANTLVAEATYPLHTTWLLEDLPKTDASLKIWTALVQVLTESEKEKCLTVLKNVLLWPFKSLNSFSEVEQPSLLWHKLYNVEHIKLNAIGFQNDLLKALPKVNKSNVAVNYFTLFAYISILKHKLLNVDQMKKLEELTSEMTNYRDFKDVIPLLVDSLVVMLDHVTTSVDESMAQTTINCVINVIRIIINEMKTESTTDTNEVSAYDKSFLLGSLLWPVTSLFKVNTYSTIIINVVNELKQHIPSLKQETVLYSTILSTMKTCLYNCSNELVNTEIRYLISLLEKITETNNCTKEFSSPNNKEVKKSKKKEATIVNTVVENGEEYIVVKSNWKFNPKNLTEHQKEKLTRKRDIPALYQDLSQSQDEFKLSSWKTDSQDTSLSSSKSSKSATNNDASEIFKNMRSMCVVPKIMENILLDNDKNVSLQKPDTVQSLVSNDKHGTEEMLTTPKGTKSPRMAFKDRVFRNVRNLIEKSSPQIECKIKNKDDQVENVSKSPVRMKIEVAKSSISKSHLHDTGTKYDAQINQNSTDVSNTLIKKVNSDNLPISTKKAANSADTYVTLNTNHMVNSPIQETNNLVDVCITPVTKQKSEINITNSEPHLLADRPARVKRKPKKYENSQLFALKKKRLSQSDSQSRLQNESQPQITIAQIHNTKDKSNINYQSQSILHHQTDANEESNLNKYQKIIVDDDSVVSEEIQACFVIQDEKMAESQICEAVDEVTVLELDSAPQIKADEGARKESKKENVGSKTITTPFNKIKSKAQIVLTPIQICNHSETNKTDTKTVTTPLNEAGKDILNKSLTTNNDLQDDNNERVEQVSEIGNINIALNSSQKTLARLPVLAIEKLDITEKQYSGPDCEIIGILENLSDRSNDSNSDNKQSSIVKDIRNRQKALTNNSLVQSGVPNNIERSDIPVNKIVDVKVPQCYEEKKIDNETGNDTHFNTVTLLNKTKDGGQQKCSTNEKDMMENNEIPDLSSVKTKDKDATQLPENNFKVNETHTNQDKMSKIPTTPSKEIKMGEDDLDKSSPKTSKRQLVVIVEKIGVAELQDLIKDCGKVVTPDKPANTIRRVGRPKSLEKTSFGQQNSKSNDEQLDKQFTPIQNIRNQQKAETSDTSTPVNKATDLYKRKSAMKRNVVDTPLSKNKNEMKDDESEMDKEISDLSIANTKDKDATQLSKQICMENEINKSQETLNTITDLRELPLKEAEMDDLEKSSGSNNDIQNDNNDRTKEVSDTNITTISVRSTKKTPSRQFLVAVDEIKETETHDCGKVGSPGKLVNKMRRGRPKSKVKTSFGQDRSKGDNEQFDKLLTPVKNVRNQQKAETPNTSTSVKKIVDQPKSSAKNNVVNNDTGNNENADVNSPLDKSLDEIKANDCEMSKKKVTLNLTRLTSTTEVKNATDKISTNNSSKKSRIEKQLMIEMVEGHPFLKAQPEKRMTRKKLMEIENRSRRKSISEKLQMAKLPVTPKAPKRPKEKKPSPSTSITVDKSQERRSNTPENVITDACSEDFIESSQDSNITALSVKSTKKTPIRLRIIVDDKSKSTETQDLIHDCENIHDITEKSHDYESIEDISLPHNKIAEMDGIDLTENMDTQPMRDDNLSKDLDELESTPIGDDSEHGIGPATQESANTAVTRSKEAAEWEFFEVLNKNQPSPTEKAQKEDPQNAIIEDHVDLEDDNDRTQTLPDDAIVPGDVENTTEVSSPFKGDDQRKQDFLNNTLEISPIRVQSPDRENICLSPETSNDFVVIKLTSPVHSNGEPFEKNGSPEFFTEEKISPEKRDESPLRVKTSVINTSPSSSLSLKKRHQVRPSGRAAQMLGLLSVSSDNMLKVTKSSDRLELDEPKKSNTSSPARRNLRILYSSVGDNSDMIELKIDTDENILKLKRALPTVTSSPSGSILKRKYVETTDEPTTSPASKRKRVSFHDPPVSTTVSVYKYIEPVGIHSPQGSAKKRHEKPMRSGLKSPKRLDTAFHLDSVLSKTVESFDMNSMETADTNASLDITPAVEIVKTSELNDTDPIFPDLVDCKDPIDVIAAELSSPAMRDLLVKELQGKVETIGDLAKMTELEVNRLCIKAPKVKVVNEVLSSYATKPSTIEVGPVINEALGEMESLPITSAEMPKNEIEVSDIEMQMVPQPVERSSTQTNSPAAHTSAKIDESGSRTSSEVVISCVSEEADSIQKFHEVLDKVSIQSNCENLPANSLPEPEKGSNSSMINIMDRVMELHNNYHGDETENSELAFLRDYLCLRYGDKVLILFCSQLLQKIGGTFCR